MHENTTIEYFHFYLFGTGLGTTYFPGPGLAFYEVVGINGL